MEEICQSLSFTLCKGTSSLLAMPKVPCNMRMPHAIASVCYFAANASSSCPMPMQACNLGGMIAELSHNSLYQLQLKYFQAGQLR